MAERIIWVHQDPDSMIRFSESNDGQHVSPNDVGDFIRKNRTATIKPVGDDDWCQSVREQCHSVATDSGLGSSLPDQSSVSYEETGMTSLTTENLSEPIEECGTSNADSNASESSSDSDSNASESSSDSDSNASESSSDSDSNASESSSDSDSNASESSSDSDSNASESSSDSVSNASDGSPDDPGTTQDMRDVKEAMVDLQLMLLYMKGPYQTDTAAAATKFYHILQSVHYSCIYPDHPPSTVITVDPADVNTSGQQGEQDGQVDDFNRLLQVVQTQIARMNFHY